MFVALFGLLLALAGPEATPPDTTADLGEYSAALTRRLTPLTVAEGTYRIYVSEAPLDVRVEALRAADPAHAPGEWEVEQADVLGVLGPTAGIADRARLARLFGGRRLRVARGAIRNGARLVAYTILSPYPDPTLSGTDGGTLVIVFQVPQGMGGRPN